MAKQFAKKLLISFHWVNIGAAVFFNIRKFEEKNSDFCVKKCQLIVLPIYEITLRNPSIPSECSIKNRSVLGHDSWLMNHRGSGSVTEAAALTNSYRNSEHHRNKMKCGSSTTVSLHGRTTFHSKLPHKITFKYRRHWHALRRVCNFGLIVKIKKWEIQKNAASPPPMPAHRHPFTMPEITFTAAHTSISANINWQTHVICMVVGLHTAYIQIYFFTRMKKKNYYQFSCVFFFLSAAAIANANNNCRTWRRPRRMENIAYFRVQSG